MVRGNNGGRLVAATVALLEKQQEKQMKNNLGIQRSNKCSDIVKELFEKFHPPEKKSICGLAGDNFDSSMDESTVKCTSSTDSGKDNQSLVSSSCSSASSVSNEELDTICCKNDFQWVSKNGPTREPVMSNKDSAVNNNSTRCSRQSTRPTTEVRFRKTSASLDRKRATRRERDHRCRSTTMTSVKSPSTCRHGECNCSAPPYFDYTPHLPPHDYRIPYYCRPPPPCDFSYRYFPKPTNELQEQLRRLESDKESLCLQVAVLTDQVEAQSEKIGDLEKTVTEQKRQISASEDLLQREMLTRSSLETQKLELLAVVSDLKRHETILEKDNIELRERLAEEKRRNKPPMAPRNHMYPATSTPTNIMEIARGVSPSSSPVSLGTHSSPRRTIEYSDSTTPPLQRIGASTQYRSLPRDHQTADSTGLRRAVVFADNDTTIVSNALGDNDSEPQSNESSPSMQTSQPKGIRKIFGRMKRSSSGNLDDIPTDDSFARGGVRSTAGPRLVGNSQPSFKPDKPFAEWSSDNICEWFKEMGLEGIVPDVKRWVKSGQTLLTATPHEIDKELNIKNALHRKKLHLALEAERGTNAAADPMLEVAGRLEPGWVLRWLDDIGLPQYKGSFMSARLDGRVLHRLNLEDLQGLHINLALHVASIKAGIYVLRKEKFDPHCLIRRSDPENDAENRVELWTNHRVMEWLRAVDLAEYAPNLRGSGVHGGLMIHEERFTDTLLASLLSIPNEKTLLRRHLSTHFKELVGAEVIHKKREVESTLGSIPLTTTLKVKAPKKSQFTLKKRKNKYEMDEGDLVCPLNDSGASRSSLSAQGDSSSPDLGKSPNHAAASPDKSSVPQNSNNSGPVKKKNDRMTEV